MQNIFVHNLFPTPVLQFKFSKHEKYQFKDVGKSVNKPDNWNCELNTSYPTIKDDDPLVNKKMRDSLIKDIELEVKGFFEKLEIPSRVKIQEIWYNIYHDNQNQEGHWHLPALEMGIPFPSWSGVYYNKNASPTIFYRNQNEFYKLYHPEMYGNSKIKHFFFEEYGPNVEDGDIVLFPPYLLHKVNTDRSFKNKMRMTFAFNLINR